MQWSLKTDQNATVYIEESDTGTSNWDISREYDYIASHGGRGETVQASKAYWRIRVVLTGTTDTTYFRLSGVLCPIAFPLPSGLSPDGRLLSETTITGKENTDRHLWITPTGAMTAAFTSRLVGTNFDGSTKDPRFWVDTPLNGGTATQGGEILLETNTTANGSIRYQSVRYARFVIGAPNRLLVFSKMESAPIADNIRRIGVYDGATGVSGNGFFFQLNGLTFGIGTRKAGTDLIVENGNFNGNYGTAWTPTLNKVNKLEIEYGEFGAYWYVNNRLLHSIELTSAVLSRLVNNLTLPVTMENVNSNDNDVNSVMGVYGASILRMGQLLTNPTSYYHAYAATTGVNLKIGAGTIHKMIFGGAQNNAVVTLSDSTSAATPALWVYTATGALAVPVSVDLGGLPFNNGLRLTVANSAAVTVVYE